jgi:transcriptional regulator with PAS, ATPase and Fis domain
MGAVNHQLFDSELFGHVKGAFTGAGVDRIGKLVAASGGTLFLDEIGNLSPELQTKLMKVLEERETCALGSNKSVKIDVRLVCATNRDLDEAVENGEFRQDLLFRINTIEINLPPLRERENDIPQLCSYFLNIFNCKYQKSIKGLSNAAHKQLSEYHFPGNVRELKHIIHRAVILCSGNVLAPEHLALRTKVKNRSISLASLNIEEAEEKLIREALAKYSGNMKRAAEALGINRTSLYRRLEKYGL